MGNFHCVIMVCEKSRRESFPFLTPFDPLRSEKNANKDLDRKNKGKKKPLRSGRIKTDEKIAKAKRHEDIYPVGVDSSTRSLCHVLAN